MAQDQRVEFLFAAQVTGQNQLEKLTQTVDKLRQETEQLKNANTTLASSTDAVIRNGVRYNNALDAQSRSLRQARQGTQQLGMQINDFATSVSTGASPIQAFNQQIGQVGYAMSMMGGTAGKVGAFLAGPWGAAVTVAAMALGFFIEQLMGADKASEELRKTEENLAKSKMALLESRYELGQALGTNIVSYKEVKAAALETAMAELASAQAAIEASRARMRAAVKEKETIDFLSATKPLGPGGSFAAGIAKLFGYGDVKGTAKKVLDDAAALNEAAAGVNNAAAALQKAMKVKVDKGSSSKGAKPKKEKQEDENKDLRDFIQIADRLSEKTLPQYQKELQSLSEAWGKLDTKEQVIAMSNYERAVEAIDLGQIARDSEAFNRTLKDGVLPQLADTLGKVTPLQDAIVTRNEELQSSFEAVGNTVSEAFKGMLTGAMSWKEGVKSLIASVINELWRLFVVQQIVGFVQKAMGSITGTPIPGKAIGGTVAKNQPYIVGERGPELFIPGGSGTIIPNRNLGGGKSGNSFNINVDARGSADPAAVRAQVQQGILEAAPAIIAAAEARTVGGLRRPRLGGVIQ